MIGDRLLITDKAFKNAKKIFDLMGDAKIILIYGMSGVQKTEIADCLQELLFKQNKQSIVFSLDDFYNTLPSIRNLNRKKLGIDSVGTQEIDWEDIKRICYDFQIKKPLKFRRVHKYADVVEHITVDSEGIDYLIIEGIFAGYLKKELFEAFAVFLEGNPSQTLKFRKLRGKENEDDKFRQQIVQREFNIVSQLKKYSDLTIPFENE